MSKNTEKINVIIENGFGNWNINMVGTVNGTYMGSFKFRCYLTPTQEIAADREYRELLGANPAFASEHVSFTAYALTQLKYRVVSAPPFWASTMSSSGYSGDLPDQEVLAAVLNAAMECEVTYRDQLKKQKLEAVERSRIEIEKRMYGSSKKDEESEVEDDEELDEI